MTVLILAIGIAGGQAVAGLSDAPRSPVGYGTKGYDWSKMTPERKEIAKLQPDAVRGQKAFRGCRGCHKSNGEGLIDGTYPRLTGQHASVIVKQVTDVRAGIRVNPKMDPFAGPHAMSLQEIADIAAFLAVTETPKENGKGPDDIFEKGRALYQRHRCAKCHGERGEGDPARSYPAIAAQHYGYLMREMEHIKARTRGNSHPDMVKAVSAIPRRELEAMSDYLSRLPDHRSVEPRSDKP